jgi:DNA-binding SARP family transcriptional activator
MEPARRGLNLAVPEGFGVVEFRLLGDVKAWHGDRRLVLGQRERAVLAVLSFRANTVVSRSEIVRLAWGNDVPATIDRLVTAYVSRLRGALREAGAASTTSCAPTPPASPTAWRAGTSAARR